MQFHFSAGRDLNQLVQSSEQMRTSQERIGHRHSRACSRMHCHRSVVFFTESCDILKFIDTGIDSRFVHESKRKSAGTFLKCTLHYFEHLCAFGFCQCPVFISGNACSRRAMTGKHSNVAWRISVDSFKELRYTRVYSCCPVI